MHVNSKTSWHKKKMACHDKYWCHKFKTCQNLWCHKNSWIAMKICETLLPNGVIKSLLIAKDKNVFN